MTFHVLIPARYASSRFPGKPLADIAGKPMVIWVVEAALKSGAADVCVATDDERILDVVRSRGFEAVMTRSDHPSGTDRLAEVAGRMNWRDEDIVVNVQGDEPLISPTLVDAVAHALAEDVEAVMSTAAWPIDSIEDFFNPNMAKVVCNAKNHAMTFSRAPIPWPRDAFAKTRDRFPAGFHPLRHIGLYAYRCGFLRQFGQLTPSRIEEDEALEQLRVLWHGYAMCVTMADAPPPPCVDTPEDLERVRAIVSCRAL